MKKRIEVLPSTVRIDNLNLLDLLSNLAEIIELNPELSGLYVSSVNLYHPRASISMSYASPESINISCGDPRLLNTLIEAIKKFYQKEEESTQ